MPLSTIRPVPPFDYEDAHYTGVSVSTNANSIVAGQGIKVRRTTNGITIAAPGQAYPAALNHRGLYNYSSSYNINDVVWVDPNVPITDQTGNVIPLSQPSGSAVIPICAGAFVCVQPVPPINVDVTYLTGTLLPAYTAAGQTIPDVVANTFRHYAYNVYYPVYPLYPSGSLTYVAEETWYVAANQTFWVPLSPMFTASICNSSTGATQSVYVSGVLSGSVFQYQLPYV
jgi:hypothetical protein